MLPFAPSSALILFFHLGYLGMPRHHARRNHHPDKRNRHHKVVHALPLFLRVSLPARLLLSQHRPAKPLKPFHFQRFRRTSVVSPTPTFAADREPTLLTLPSSAQRVSAFSRFLRPEFILESARKSRRRNGKAARQQGGSSFRENSSNGGKAIRTF